MPRVSRRGKKKRRRKLARVPNEEIKKSPHSKSRRLGEALGFVSLAVALLIFWPRLKISVNGEDPVNPFSGQITIENDTPLLSLRIEKVGVGICQAVTEPASFDLSYHCDSDRLKGFSVEQWSDFRLEADKQSQFPLDKILRVREGAKISGADIAVWVTYRWWIIPVPLRRSYRFVALPDANGLLRWYARASDARL
jgi:hypothetical protein